MIKRRNFLKKLRPVARNCPFCKNNVEPDYKDVEGLKAYISERAKIIGKDRTGICSKHQRRLGRQIRRARFLALLPFTTSVR